MHSNSEDNICVEYDQHNSSPGKCKKQLRLDSFIKRGETAPQPDKQDFRRTRLPSFKMHDESEETLQRIKEFKADNQLSDVKQRNRTNSLEI